MKLISNNLALFTITFIAINVTYSWSMHNQKQIISTEMIKGHKDLFKNFVVRVGAVHTATSVTSYIPFANKLISLGASAAGYDFDPKETGYLKRFFADQNKLQQAIAEFEATENNVAYLKDICNEFKKKPTTDRTILKQVVHKKIVMKLDQPADTTEEALREKVHEQDNQGSYAIEDELYYSATTGALMSFYLHHYDIMPENNE